MRWERSRRRRRERRRRIRRRRRKTRRRGKDVNWVEEIGMQAEKSIVSIVQCRWLHCPFSAGFMNQLEIGSSCIGAF